MAEEYETVLESHLPHLDVQCNYVIVTDPIFKLEGSDSRPQCLAQGISPAPAF
jgi:hypothetical protein